jgi:hypothetical protein
VTIDLDSPGKAFDAGWAGALERIAARTKPGRHRSPAEIRYAKERLNRQ